MTFHPLRTKERGVLVNAGHVFPAYWYVVQRDGETVEQDDELYTLYDLVAALDRWVDWSASAAALVKLADAPWKERAEDIGEFGPALIIEQALEARALR